MAGNKKPADRKKAVKASVPRDDSRNLLKKVPKLKKIKPGKGNR